MDLPNPRIESRFPVLQADSSPVELSWKPKEALPITEERRDAKGKGETERYIQLNAEFQRIARRDEKAFLNEQCKEKGEQQSGKD